MTHSTPDYDEQPRSRRRFFIMGAVVVALIAIIALVGRSRFWGPADASGAAAAGAPGEMPPMPVDVDTARREVVIDAVRATGRIEAMQAVDLRPDEQGRITALLFTEGQTVAEGAPLIKIDDAMMRAQLERLKADRDLARQQLDR